MTLEAGGRLGPYEIGDPIGSGGMGVVYRARDPRLGREVAIKVLPPSVAQDPDRLRRFEQEARAASAIHHPNLLTVFDVGTHEGTAYLVTELLEGEPLRALVERGRVGEKQTLDIAVQIAGGLAAAHEKGIVHRDLKPENIFLTRSGIAKILDFGIARIEPRAISAGDPADAPTLHKTSAGTVLGTVGYMSPEQVRGERTDARSDIFSLGVVLYEMLAGKRPFEGSTGPEVMSAVLRDEPPPFGGPGGGGGAEAIARRCLSKRPEDRYQSSLDLARALRDLATTPASEASTSRAPGRRRAAAIAAVALVAAGVLIVLGIAHALRPSPRAAVEAPPVRSLAVLPFANLSGREGQDYFSDGFTDELTITLTRLPGIKVIARTSAAGYKGSTKRAVQIGEDLGVDGLVSGSVLKSRDRVRITAQLVSAPTEITLWAESYERDVGDVFDVQSEVARAIADAISVRLSPEESARLAGPKSVDPRAIDAYLRGRALWNQRTEAAVREGLQQFDNAARLAPGFAPAFAGIADSQIILGVYGFESPRKAFPEAKTAARHAIEIDPAAGEPHASLGDILFHYDWNWEGADGELRKAIELSPGFATAYHWRSEPLLLTGRAGEALESIRRARSLDPLSMVIRATLARVLWASGDREGAIAALREAVSLDPRFLATRVELARELLFTGHAGEAVAEARQAVEASPGHVPARAVLGLCLAAGGQAEEARAILLALDKEGGRRFVSSLDRARITAGLRDLEATLRYLERAVVEREGNLPFMEMDDEFGFLRGDPRYTSILKSIGVPDAGQLAN